MKEWMVITYITALSVMLYYGTQTEFNVVSKCCKYEYKKIPKALNPDNYSMLCLNCKQWCDLIEIRETK